MSEVPPPDPSAEQPQDRTSSPGSEAPPPGAVPPPQNAAFPPAGTGGPVPPHRPAAAGFFDSLRRTGLARTNERWIGGVAGGVARRLDLDPTLVRCVWAVLVVFSGLGLVLYGLGWALMPEESDGRIHLEQALGGDFDAGLAGAVATFVSGWVLLDHGLLPSWYIRGWVGSDYYDAFWAVMWTCLMLGAAYWGYRAVRRRRQPYQQPPTPGNPAYRATPAPSGQPGHASETSAPAAPTPHPTPYAPVPQPGMRVPNADTRVPNAPGPQPGPRVAGAPRPTAPPNSPMQAVAPANPGRPAPRPVAPVRPRRPGPGRRLGLSIAGIIFCCLAAIVLLGYAGHMGTLAAWLAAVGAVTALLGVGVITSALRGRRGGWMTALGWLAAMVAVPVLALGTGLPEGALSARHTTWGATAHTVTLTWDDLERKFADARGDANTTVNLGDYAAGQVILDLTDMPAGEEPPVRATLSVGVGAVTIRTLTGQNLAVNSTVGLGATYADTMSDWQVDGGALSDYSSWQQNRYTVDGDPVTFYHSERWYPGEQVSLVSPAAREADAAVSLDIEVGVGAVNVDERPSQVTWYGVQDDTAWIVESWVDTQGKSHNSLPVPGMAHAAIGTEAANTCGEAVTTALDEISETDADSGETGNADDSEDGEDQGWYGDWYSVPELTGAGRKAWDDCVNQALETESVAGGADSSATPSASPSSTAAASPSATAAEPSPTPTH